MVHNFEQLEVSSDLNMKKSEWKKIKTYMDARNPTFKKTSKTKYEEICEFLESDEEKKALYL